MSALKTWYAGLEQREKSMISMLGFAVGLLLFLLLVVLPTKNYFNQLQLDRDSYLSSLPIVKKQVNALKGKSSGGNVNQSLNQMVTSSGRNFGLKFSRIEEKKRNKEIQINLDDAEFDQLIRWVLELEQNKGLIIDIFRASETDDPGRVDASIKVVRTS